MTNHLSNKKEENKNVVKIVPINIIIKQKLGMFIKNVCSNLKGWSYQWNRSEEFMNTDKCFIKIVFGFVFQNTKGSLLQPCPSRKCEYVNLS